MTSESEFLAHRTSLGVIEKQLGPSIELFRPSRANVIAGVVIGILAIGGGLGLLRWVVQGIIGARGRLPLLADRELSWITGGFFTIVGLALLALGIVLLLWMVKTTSLSVDVREHGLVYTRAGKPLIFPWNDLTEIQMVVIHEKIPLATGAAKHLMPTVTSRSYVVVRRDGQQAPLTSNDIQGVDRCGELLRQAAQQHAITWRVVEEWYAFAIPFGRSYPKK